MQERRLIYGPPGTGKTTRLIETLNMEIEDGADPERIGFVTFTRKAATEAQSRLSIELPWCRTLHSLAYHWHGLSRSEVMGAEHLREFGRRYGYDIFPQRDEITGLFITRGDNDLLNAIELARTRLTDPLTEAQRLGLEDPVWRIVRFAEDLHRFKADEHLWDFTDMLERLEDGPELDVLIVDEAQDLTPLQWRVVDLLARGCRRVYVAGDDDQAIYEWAGADVRHLIRMEGEREVLRQSHRVPQAVQRLAGTIARGISERVDKDWLPRAEVGDVELGVELSDLDPAEGTWMMLARTHRMARQFEQHLRAMGYLYRTAHGPAVRDKDWEAIRTWERLRKGQPQPAGAIKACYELMDVGRGIARGTRGRLDEVPDDDLLGIGDLRERFGLLTDAPWFDALVRLGDEQIEYLRRCLANGERQPRCYVGTIHSVKGGEADNVVLCPDVPTRVKLGTDAERRVWYVGVTRARERVLVLRPRTVNAALI